MPFVSNPPVTIHKWPAKLAPNQLTIHLQSHTSRFDTPFTRATQTQELPGGRFTLSAGWPPLDDGDTRLYRAFMAKLRGSAGRFYFPAEARTGAVPDGGAAEAQSVQRALASSTKILASSTVVKASAETYVATATATATAGSTSRTIATQANQPVGTLIVAAGRHVSFDTVDGWRQLHVVVDDAVVEAGRIVHINVEPPMRAQPAVGAPLHLRAPSGVFMLASDDQGQVSQRPGRQVRGQTSLEAVEAYPPRIAV